MESRPFPGAGERRPEGGEEFYHLPVLKKESVESLVTDREGVYVDGTLGGGGHARAILEALGPKGRLIGIDRDPEALEECRKRLSGFGSRFTAVQGNYSRAKELLSGLGIEAVNGILLDLGVSSRQLDEGERGFSFMRPGPLDMRMGPDAAKSAGEIVNASSEEELAKIFREYGEERHAKRAARAIAAARAESPITTTGELASIIEKALGRRSEKHPATKIFQGLRIAVNRELEGLASFLESVPSLLLPGGRVAIISYHSLEDRMVKQTLREFEPHCICPERSPVCTCEEPGVLKVLTRKAIKPSGEEIRTNSRARSARLRVAEKIRPS